MSAVSTRLPEALKTDQQIAIERIMVEAECTRYEAMKTIAWVKKFVCAARRDNYATQYPTDEQLDSGEYGIFDAIMPHGAGAQPGSAHEALEKLVLDPTRDEYSLRHNMDGQGYCEVDILISTP